MEKPSHCDVQDGLPGAADLDQFVLKAKLCLTFGFVCRRNDYRCCRIYIRRRKQPGVYRWSALLERVLHLLDSLSEVRPELVPFSFGPEAVVTVCPAGGFFDLTGKLSPRIPDFVAETYSIPPLRRTGSYRWDHRLRYPAPSAAARLRVRGWEITPLALRDRALELDEPRRRPLPY